MSAAHNDLDSKQCHIQSTKGTVSVLNADAELFYSDFQQPVVLSRTVHQHILTATRPHRDHSLTAL
jgi:hypothetical protein